MNDSQQTKEAENLPEQAGLVGPSSALPASPSVDVRLNAWAQVVGSPHNNLRAGPSVQDLILAQIDPGSRVWVMCGPVKSKVDKTVWWVVRYAGAYREAKLVGGKQATKKGGGLDTVSRNRTVVGWMSEFEMDGTRILKRVP